MYQVVINNKYYVSDICGTILQDLNAIYDYVERFELTLNKCDAKFFEYEREAQSIAEQIGGKVIEYSLKEVNK